MHKQGYSQVKPGRWLESGIGKGVGWAGVWKGTRAWEGTLEWDGKKPGKSRAMGGGRSRNTT